LVIDLFKEYFPQLTVDDVLMGVKKIFIKLQAMPAIEKKFQELVIFK
jgi:hypothetical protein